MSEVTTERLQIQISGSADLPTLIYLPGLHGDWTLLSSFRKAVAGRIRLVEFTYPRTTSWSLENYAEAILESLQQQGISSAWLLGESFGSQIVWAILQILECEQFPKMAPTGAIFAGGFITYPRKMMIRLCWQLIDKLPKRILKSGFWFYRKYAPIRHGHASDCAQIIDDFLALRTEPDRQAILHRLRLIQHADFRPFTQTVRTPVYYLAGFFDPIVPWASARRSFRRHCPALVDSKICRCADHIILVSGPARSAEIILGWMRSV